MNKTIEQKKREGFAMLMALLMLFIASTFAALLYRQSMQAMHTVKLHKASDQAQLAAQSALGQMRKGIAEKFQEYYLTKNRHFHQLDNWFNTHNGKKIGTAGVFYEFPEVITVSSYPDAEIVLDFASTDFTKNTKGMAFADLTFTAQARMGGATRAVREQSRCEFKQSSVFDYAYFLNNFGWFYDVNMVVNGDIRSNQETELSSSSLVLNGNSFSAGTTHLIKQYKQWNNSTYESQVSTFARPLENPFSSNTTTTWDRGYNLSKTEVIDKQNEVPMPYLGNTDGYIEYAEHNHGTVKQGNKTLVDAYYDGPGLNENPKATADDGTLILIGTLNNPIEINGPVVVKNDLIIKGYIKGQGSFYVGRNVHIIDDLKYVNPPKWVKPLQNIDTAVKDTVGSDFVGLCAKGNVILGDYNSYDFQRYKNYMKPPFTSAYVTDESDASIGYCNTTKNGEKAFTGDYTANYGVKPHNNSWLAAKGRTVNRPYYSSSLSDNDFASLYPASKITQLDAMVYNNHIMAGSFNSNAKINGGLVCRDEAMILSGKLEMNWDTRLNGDPRLPGKPYGQGLGNSFEPFLPIGNPVLEYQGWSEIAPTLSFANNSKNKNK